MQDQSKLFQQTASPQVHLKAYYNTNLKQFHLNSPVGQGPSIANQRNFQIQSQSKNVNEFQLKSSTVKAPPSKSQNLFLIQENYQPCIPSLQSPELDIFAASQSPESMTESRGRDLQSSQSLNSKKKGVLVIKKESINRQNSQSRSPVHAQQQLDESLGSPYHSPKASEIIRYQNKASFQGSKNSIRTDQETNLIQNEMGTSVKNSVIVRKTVGEIRRTHLDNLYFDSNLTKSCGPAQNEKPTLKGLQKLESDYQGRNQMKIQHNQRKALQNEKIDFDIDLGATLPRKSMPLTFVSEKHLTDLYDQNRQDRQALLQERLEHSSESDDIFERQSSNTLSVENLNLKNGIKKIVISKKSVNFCKAGQSAVIDKAKQKHDHSKSQEQLGRVLTQDDRHRNSAKLDFDRILEINSVFNVQSQSPDCLRRQKSDNLISTRSNKKTGLAHERSSNSLTLHLQNKFEAPKVVKAIPNAVNQELLRSPTTAYSTKDSQKVVASIGANPSINLEQSKVLLNKSRQANIFQMRRSQTFKQEEQERQQNLAASKIQQNQQKLKSPSKKHEIIKKQNESSRVCQSLLLDNYYSKSKERPEIKLKDSFTVKQELTGSQLELNNSSTGPSSYKMSPETQNVRQISKDQVKISSDQDAITVPNYLSYNRRSTLTYHINRLIEENRCNSPVRVSQYLVDIDYIKTKALEKINSQANGEMNNGKERKTSEDNCTMVPQQPLTSQSSSTNAIISLSQVNTSEKFKEIIDNLFVPTASAFKKKMKEREFRRPTQNPIRRSKSLQRSQKSNNGQGIKDAVKQKDEELRLEDF